MRVLVIGATGPLGIHITRRALEAFHEVTVLVRDPARMPLQHKNLRAVTGDVLQIGSIDPAMTAQDAVICSLGIKPASGKVTLFSEGTDNVIRAMRRHNARRLICITGMGAGTSPGRGGFFYDRIIHPFLRRQIYDDKARQEQLVCRSDRDWMVVRPARLTSGPARRRYGVSLHSTGVRATSISRADVAEFVVSQLDKVRYLYRIALLTN